VEGLALIDMSEEIHQYPPRFWFSYAVYMGVSNFLWEVVQLPLYTLWTERFNAIVFAVLHCTGGDVLIGLSSLVASIFLVRLTGRPRGGLARQRITAFGAVMIGFGYTVFSEWLNVYIRKSWDYSELMPLIRVGEVAIGLSPMAQWLILPPVYFLWMGCVWRKR
jgi:hypothetical protein